MSGHSKWSTIKRQKSANDAKRGQAFTKAGNAITIAAREGGGSPETNFKLRLAVEAARAVNMPKENIERAISRATGAGGEKALEEVTYEGFGPSGVAIMIDVVTDNKMRSTAEVRSLLERGGGSLAGPGSVSYLFKATGMINVEDIGSEEELINAAVSAGADDVDTEGKSGTIFTDPTKVSEVQEKLTGSELKIVGREVSKEPTTQIKITDSYQAEKILSLISKLEDLDDVQKVYSNFDISTDIMEKVA